MSFREELTFCDSAIWLIHCLCCYQCHWPNCYSLFLHVDILLIIDPWASLSETQGRHKGLKQSLLLQEWLRIRLPTQGTRVPYLVWEDPTGERGSYTQEGSPSVLLGFNPPFSWLLLSPEGNRAGQERGKMFWIEKLIINSVGKLGFSYRKENFI